MATEKAKPAAADPDLTRALEILRAGGVILYPTETVWGIGCDATRPEAVARVFEIKRRADSKALISLVADAAMLERWVDPVPEAAMQLVEASDGATPLTIVYDSPRGLAPNLLAPDGSAALRVTQSRFAARLCRALRRPLVSTSANISGAPAPRSWADISPEIKEAVDYGCTTGRDDVAALPPSPVIKVTDSGVITIIRK